MTSLSCVEIRSSICAIRALIIASVSAAIVTVPLSTSVTKFLTRSLPRSLAAASRPSRPWSTILSRRLPSDAASKVVCCWPCACVSAIGASLESNLRLELLHRFGVVERALKNLFELVVALQVAAEIRQLRAEVEQLLERPDVLRDRFRVEVVERLEGEVDANLPA